MKKFRTIDNKYVTFRRLVIAEFSELLSQLGLLPVAVEGRLYKLSLSEYVKYSKYLEECLISLDSAYVDYADAIKRNRETILLCSSFAEKIQNDEIQTDVVQSGLIEIHCE